MEQDSMRQSPIVMSQFGGERGRESVGWSDLRRRSLPEVFSKNQRGTKRKEAVILLWEWEW